MIEKDNLQAQRLITPTASVVEDKQDRAIRPKRLADYVGQPHVPVLEKAGDIAALMTNLQPGDVLFIDEIHRLSPVVEEVLYPAMEDYQLDIMIGEGPAARSIKLELPPFWVC